MAHKYKLTYFNVRAIAEPVRLLFHYANVEFEDYRLDSSEWPGAKDRYPWGVLPMLEVDGRKLSQSFAIGRFLGKEFNLMSCDEFESAKCDEYGDVLKDLMSECRGLIMEKDAVKKAAIRDHFITVQVPKYFSTFDKNLADNGGKYLVGNCITWIDFFAAYYFDFIENIVALSILDDYPHVKFYTKSILNIPQIKHWIEIRPVTPI